MKGLVMAMTAGLVAGAAALAFQADKDLRAGLVGEYYNVGKKMEKVPDFGSMKPVSRHVERMVDLGGSSKVALDPTLKSYWAARWTGWIKVPKDGAYTFFLKSKEGSKLYLDGKLLIDNEVHAAEEVSKTTDLKVGNHEFKIEYYVNDGPPSCQVWWEYEGEKKQTIPAAAFWHKYDKDLDGPAK